MVNRQLLRRIGGRKVSQMLDNGHQTTFHISHPMGQLSDLVLDTIKGRLEALKMLEH